jgi:hypothetical protein
MQTAKGLCHIGRYHFSLLYQQDDGGGAHWKCEGENMTYENFSNI